MFGELRSSNDFSDTVSRIDPDHCRKRMMGGSCGNCRATAAAGVRAGRAGRQDIDRSHCNDLTISEESRPAPRRGQPASRRRPPAPLTRHRPPVESGTAGSNSGTGTDTDCRIGLGSHIARWVGRWLVGEHEMDWVDKIQSSPNPRATDPNPVQSS